MKNSTLKYDFGLLLVTIIWGYGFLATKYAVDEIPSIQIIFYRFAIASIIMLVVFRKDIAAATKTDIKNSMLLGAFLAIAFYTQTDAVRYTTIEKSAFLTTLNVIIVPVIYAAVYKRRVDNYAIAGCLFALVGTTILSFNMDFSINFGDVLSISSAFFFAMQIFYQGVFLDKTKPTVLATGQMFFAAIFSFAFSLLTGQMHFAPVSNQAIFGVLYLGIMSSAVCYLAQAYCQQFTSSVKTVVIFSLEAVFASIFAIIILRGPVTSRFLIGSTCIFMGTIISSTKLEFLRNSQLTKIKN